MVLRSAMRSAPLRSLTVAKPWRSAPWLLVLSLCSLCCALPVATWARTATHRPWLTPDDRQHQAEVAEQALWDAREARQIGQSEQACALDRLVVQSLSQAHVPGTEAEWAIELISAQRNVLICQERNL